MKTRLRISQIQSVLYRLFENSYSREVRELVDSTRISRVFLEVDISLNISKFFQSSQMKYIKHSETSYLNTVKFITISLEFHISIS
jgi:hypothetical protein